jgi:hypothetical protein
MLRKIENRPESMKAGGLLVDALAYTQDEPGNQDAISPDSSWIHPLL